MNPNNSEINLNIECNYNNSILNQHNVISKDSTHNFHDHYRLSNNEVLNLVKIELESNINNYISHNMKEETFSSFVSDPYNALLLTCFKINYYKPKILPKCSTKVPSSSMKNPSKGSDKLHTNAVYHTISICPRNAILYKKIEFNRISSCKIKLINQFERSLSFGEFTDTVYDIIVKAINEEIVKKTHFESIHETCDENKSHLFLNVVIVGKKENIDDQFDIVSRLSISLESDCLSIENTLFLKNKTIDNINGSINKIMDSDLVCKSSFSLTVSFSRLFSSLCSKADIDQMGNITVTENLNYFLAPAYNDCFFDSYNVHSILKKVNDHIYNLPNLTNKELQIQQELIYINNIHLHRRSQSKNEELIYNDELLLTKNNDRQSIVIMKFKNFQPYIHSKNANIHEIIFPKNAMPLAFHEINIENINHMTTNYNYHTSWLNHYFDYVYIMSSKFMNMYIKKKNIHSVMFKHKIEVCRHLIISKRTIMEDKSNSPKIMFYDTQVINRKIFCNVREYKSDIISDSLSCMTILENDYRTDLADNIHKSQSSMNLARCYVLSLSYSIYNIELM